MTNPAPGYSPPPAVSDIAKTLVRARREARALPGFPGELPNDLETAYACQEAAIALWPDTIAGWKVGRIPPQAASVLGHSRLAGPIFKRAVRLADGQKAVNFPVFDGGFAAVEPEFVFRLGSNAPADKLSWSVPEALELIDKLHIGVETAGSPMAPINKLGHMAVISDFGNNNGLILGPEIAGWRRRPIEELIAETFIDGKSVGRGGAASLPGGHVEGLRFLVEHCARRGRPLKKGDLVSSGAATGVHDILIGQSARMDFGQDGQIACVAVKAQPAVD